MGARQEDVAMSGPQRKKSRPLSIIEESGSDQEVDSKEGNTKDVCKTSLEIKGCDRGDDADENGNVKKQVINGSNVGRRSSRSSVSQLVKNFSKPNSGHSGNLQKQLPKLCVTAHNADSPKSPSKIPIATKSSSSSYFSLQSPTLNDKQVKNVTSHGNKTPEILRRRRELPKVPPLVQSPKISVSRDSDANDIDGNSLAKVKESVQKFNNKPAPAKPLSSSIAIPPSPSLTLSTSPSPSPAPTSSTPPSSSSYMTLTPGPHFQHTYVVTSTPRLCPETQHKAQTADIPPITVTPCTPVHFDNSIPIVKTEEIIIDTSDTNSAYKTSTTSSVNSSTSTRRNSINSKTFPRRSPSSSPTLARSKLVCALANRRLSNVSNDLRLSSESLTSVSDESDLKEIKSFIDSSSATNDSDSHIHLSSDFERLQETTERLHLTTRRPSVMQWRQKYLESPGVPRVFQNLNTDSNDGRLTSERKQRIDDALDWLRNELLDMRSQDQTLARQLLAIRHDIHKLKLQRSTEQHQDFLDDFASELEDLQEFHDVLDLPTPPMYGNHPLKHVGVTRLNINSRRFSAC